MAFSPRQKRNHIHEIQRYLHALSYMNEQIPRIIPDGFYGRETAIAVRAFQREYGLPETGNVDFATWNKIVSVYREYLHGTPLAYDVFPSSGYVVREGDSGLIVYILEAMLDDIAIKNDNMPRVKVDGRYSEDTIQAVKRFQNKMGLPANGNVDNDTWNMLVRTSEHINKTIPLK